VSFASIILLTFIAQASPPGTDKKAAAREMLVEGQAMYEKANYAGALRKFAEAYATFPSPKIWINIGNADMNLGRDVEALEAFDNFLRFAADEPVEKRDYADKQVAKLKRRLGQLSIDCNLGGADVALDGRNVGSTPLAAPIWTPPGSHRLLVTHPDALPSEQRLEVSAGKPELIQVHLQIQARPDGRPQGSASSGWTDTAQTHAARARNLYEAGDYAGAISEMEAERRLNPDPNILYNIGQAYRKWGMREQAIIAYRQFLGAVPQADNRPQVERLIAELQRASGMVGAPPPVPAVQPARAPVNAAMIAQEHQRRARLLYEGRRYPEAINELEAEYALDANPIALYNLGQSFRYWGRLSEAIRAYRHYLMVVPQAGNRPEVEASITEIVGRLRATGAHVMSAQEHARRANASYQAGGFSQAVAELEAEYVLDGDANVLYNLGQTYRLWGRLEQAMRAYRQYLTQLPQAANRPQVERILAELQDGLARRIGLFPGRM
jgi:tetratricopeptide (TPR) repeat protein